MTCIVGIEHQGKVYMGADSLVSLGWAGQFTTPSKLFRKGDLLLGFTGDVRTAQVVQFQTTIPIQSQDQSDHEYMVNGVAEAIRAALKEHGSSTVKENQEQSESCFLIGYRGHLYTLYHDYSVCPALEGFYAIGSGGLVALGTLAVTLDLPPKRRLRTALKVAQRFADGVRSPFILETLKGE